MMLYEGGLGFLGPNWDITYVPWKVECSFCTSVGKERMITRYTVEWTTAKWAVIFTRNDPTDVCKMSSKSKMFLLNFWTHCLFTPGHDVHYSRFYKQIPGRFLSLRNPLGWDSNNTSLRMLLLFSPPRWILVSVRDLKPNGTFVTRPFLTKTNPLVHTKIIR